MAQLDSASDSDSEGRRFESFRVGQKNDKFRQKFVVFYPSRRLGMESRVSVYGIAVGVWHHQRCIFLRLNSIRLLCNQFHTATSCGFHARLRRDWVRAGSNPSVKKVKYLFYRPFTKNDKFQQKFVVFQLCLPWRASGVVFDSDVQCVSDVSPIGEVGKHYITATIGSNITMRSITSLRLAATSLLSHEFKSILKNEKYLFYPLRKQWHIITR